MALTEAALQASIQAEGYGTDSASAQAEAIKAIWRRVLAQKPWSFLEAQATLTAVAGTAAVALTSVTDLARVDAVRLSFGTEGWDLEYVDPNRARGWLIEDLVSALPQVWTSFAQSIHLYPRPDRAYTLTIDYKKRPTYSTTDIVFPEEHQDVLVWGAIARMAFRQRDYTAAAYAETQYKDHLADMIRTYSIKQRQSTLEVGHHHVWGEVEV